MDDLTPDSVRQRDVRADVETEPPIGPLRRASAPGVYDVESGAAMDGFQQVMKEDRVRLAGVRSPQDQQIRLLDLRI